MQTAVTDNLTQFAPAGGEAQRLFRRIADQRFHEPGNIENIKSYHLQILSS